MNLLAPVAVLRRFAQRLQLRDFLFRDVRPAELPGTDRADKAGHRLGVGIDVRANRKRERFGPCGALQHKPGGRSGLSRVSSVGPPSAELCDRREFVDHAAGLTILAEVQIRVRHEILRVRLLRERRTGSIPGRVLARGFHRGLVRPNRVFPASEDRIDV